MVQLDLKESFMATSVHATIDLGVTLLFIAKDSKYLDALLKFGTYIPVKEDEPAVEQKLLQRNQKVPIRDRIQATFFCDCPD